MSDVASLIFYLLLFSASALFFYFGQRYSSRIWTVIALSIPIIIGGLRYYVGTDYASYERLFNNLINTSFTDYLANNTFNIEPGFFALIKLCQLFSSEPSVLFLASSLLTVIFFHWGLKNIQIKHKSLVYLLYLTTLYPITFNATRQGIAISIVFLAVTYIMQAKNKKFILMIILASAFHLSALIGLVAHPIFKLLTRKHDDITPKRFLIRTVTTFAAIIGLVPVAFNLLTQISIFEKYANYANYVSGVSATMIFFKMATIVTVTYFYKKLSSKNTNLRAFYILALLEVSTISLWFNSAAIFRISLFFTPFTLVLLSELPEVFRTRADKVIMQLLLVAFCIAYFYVAYFVAGQAEIFPYQFIR